MSMVGGMTKLIFNGKQVAVARLIAFSMLLKEHHENVT